MPDRIVWLASKGNIAQNHDVAFDGRAIDCFEHTSRNNYRLWRRVWAQGIYVCPIEKIWAFASFAGWWVDLVCLACALATDSPQNNRFHGNPNFVELFCAGNWCNLHIRLHGLCVRKIPEHLGGFIGTYRAQQCKRVLFVFGGNPKPVFGKHRVNPYHVVGLAFGRWKIFCQKNGGTIQQS